jgi:hypothetical protein
MNRIEYLMIHCLATRPTTVVDKATLERWHMMPRDEKNGTVTYKGKAYRNRKALPKEMIGGKPIETGKGRGWDRCGYAGYWTKGGKYVEITPYDDDAYIGVKEKTWGAAGMNSTTRHFAYEGGLDVNGNPQDTRTQAQLFAIELWVLDHIAKFPWIKVCGHNQVANKACPCFDVPTWLRSIGVKEKNIYLPK